MEAAPVDPSWLGEPGSTRDVLYRLLADGPTSRGELAERTGLSAASLSRVTKPLIEAGEVREASHRQIAPSGRSTRPLEIDAGRHHFAGLKITGTHAYAALVDLRADVVATRNAALTSPAPDAVADHVVELVGELEQASGFASAGIGVCLGGQVGADGVVSRARFLQWEDVPFGRLVGDRTHRPVAVSNDVHALTLIEHWRGSGQGAANLVVLTLGAGVGYGLVVNNRMIADANTGLGGVGHVPLDPFGPSCALGHRGCADAMLTIPSLEAQAFLALHRPVAYEELLGLAATDLAASAIVDRAAFALGRLIGLASAFTMTERIVLAGEGIGLATTARDALSAGRAADKEPHANEPDLTIADVSHTDWARGAAMAVMQLPAPN